MNTNTIDILPEYSRRTPQVYAYSDTAFSGQLKVGYIEREDVMQRIREQYPIKTPTIIYRLEWHAPALFADGSGDSFSDKDIHRHLKKAVFSNEGEWFRCSLNDVMNAYEAVRLRQVFEHQRHLSFPMRTEQKAAVEKTLDYFKKIDSEKGDVTPHFLWNAKMRFGKTFATYHLAKAMNAKRVLILTFKPAVEESWHDDLMFHTDFDGWQFFSSRDGGNPENLNQNKPIVCFGSFQDYLGTTKEGAIKVKNEWVHSVSWDLIVLDEYHFGAWNENAKTLLDIGEKSDKQTIEEQNALLQEDGYDIIGGKIWDEDLIPITRKHFLYLSGTPFRAITSGEFMEDQIFNWTYQDEQRAKNSCTATPDPYAELPTMVMLTFSVGIQGAVAPA